MYSINMQRHESTVQFLFSLTETLHFPLVGTIRLSFHYIYPPVAHSLTNITLPLLVSGVMQ